VDCFARKYKDPERELDPVDAKCELERIRKGLEALQAGQPGAEEFDLVEAERNQERIAKGLKALLAKQKVSPIDFDFGGVKPY